MNEIIQEAKISKINPREYLQILKNVIISKKDDVSVVLAEVLEITFKSNNQVLQLNYLKKILTKNIEELGKFLLIFTLIFLCKVKNLENLKSTFSELFSLIKNKFKQIRLITNKYMNIFIKKIFESYITLISRHLLDAYLEHNKDLNELKKINVIYREVFSKENIKLYIDNLFVKYSHDVFDIDKFLDENFYQLEPNFVREKLNDMHFKNEQNLKKNKDNSAKDISKRPLNLNKEYLNFQKESYTDNKNNLNTDLLQDLQTDGLCKTEEKKNEITNKNKIQGRFLDISKTNQSINNFNMYKLKKNEIKTDYDKELFNKEEEEKNKIVSTDLNKIYLYSHLNIKDKNIHIDSNQYSNTDIGKKFEIENDFYKICSPNFDMSEKSNEENDLKFIIQSRKKNYRLNDILNNDKEFNFENFKNLKLSKSNNINTFQNIKDYKQKIYTSGNSFSNTIEKNIPHDSHLEVFREEVLKYHNLKRKIHSSDELIPSDELQNRAQEWAEIIAAKNELEKRNMIIENEKIGENLACIENINHFNVIDKWYQQINNYNFVKPNSSSLNENFSQMIWKNTKYIGFGYKTAFDGKYYVVAFYYPKGNIYKEFKENVLPLE